MSEEEIIKREILKALDNFGPMTRETIERYVHCSLRDMNRKRWNVSDPQTGVRNTRVCNAIFGQIDRMLEGK